MAGNYIATKLYDAIYLISCAVNCTVPDTQRVQAMDLVSIHKLSRFHNLSSTVYTAVEAAELGEDYKEILSSWEQEQLYSIFREEEFNTERGRLLKFCEENKIWYMPLKGAILKDYYPYPGMRQMGDNDILFDKNYREQIRQWFTDNGYEVENYKRGNHDVYRKDSIMFEMHTELFSSLHDHSLHDYYANVEERLLRDDADSFSYHFTDEDLYVYLTAHEYKHYLEGGVGLRFLLDDYMFLKAEESSLDWDHIDGELKKLGAYDFGIKTRILSRKLFDGNLEPEILTAEEREFFDEIVQSGTFGTTESHIMRKIEKQGGDKSHGKLKYIWKRLFPDIWFMREFYPLCRYPILVPFVYIYRIVYKLATGKDKLRHELDTLRKM